MQISLREALAVRNIRIFFKKRDRAKYISHLDMTRLFQRAVRRTGMTMWYTEGFHPHLYMTFALPLSLGTESDCECVDMRLLDEITLEGVKERLNFVLPEGIEVYDVSEPQMKANRIESSEYAVKLYGLSDKKEEIISFLNRQEINAIKKGKAGEKLVNIKPFIYDFSVTENKKDLDLILKLASGNTNTLNPALLLNVFSEESGASVDGAFILRKRIFAENGEEFK